MLVLLMVPVHHGQDLYRHSKINAYTTEHTFEKLTPITSSGFSLLVMRFTPRSFLSPSVNVYTPRMARSMITRQTTNRARAKSLISGCFEKQRVTKTRLKLAWERD